ncbi:MAG: YbhB/YbcL family Raf kinase inhibitor-like protein [Armatimonadetes bacterium]|nr:YbhB/YbcL family Raf kinase inhibitor-like protein [Armatimonadota bacterium]
MVAGANEKSYLWVLSKTNIPIDQEFELTSTSFEDGGKIPDKYAGEDGISPPLAWKGAPAGTKSFMLICTDPDAPSPLNPDPTPFIHWLMLNIPADTKFLMPGVPQLEQVSTPFGAVQAANGHGEIGYSGPTPPKGSGRHRYYFTLFALDRVHVLDPNLTPEEFIKILDSSVLAKTELMGTYEVPASSFQDSRMVLRSSEPLTMVLEMALRAAQLSNVGGFRH